MKTVRFSQVVEKSGAPESHLLLSAPEKDKSLQSALRQHRVMTVHQTLVGTAKDHGSVGLEEDESRQILIFPKSLRDFEGAKVVGINYDLLEAGAEEAPPRKSAPKRKPAAKVPPATKAKPKPKPKASSAAPDETPRTEAPEPPKLEPILKAVQVALDQLEEGKQIAAFKTLKTLLENH